MAPSKLVDPLGRPFEDFLESNPDLVEWALNQSFICEIVFRYHKGDLFEEYVRQEVEEFVKRKERQPNEKDLEDIKKLVKESMRRALKRYVSSSELAYGPERIAYYIVAKWMQNNRDPLWSSIIGKTISDEDLPQLAM